MELSIPTFTFLKVDSLNPPVGFYMEDLGYTEYPSLDVFLEHLSEFQARLGRKKNLTVSYHDSGSTYGSILLRNLLSKDYNIHFIPGLRRITWKDKKIVFDNVYGLLPFALGTLKKAFDSWTPLTNSENKCLLLSEILTCWWIILHREFEVDPSQTLATTAVKTFDRKFFPLKRIERNEKFEEFITQATYGGRNEIYKKYGENIYFYDVNSMYMSCYDIPVPIGKLAWTKPNIDRGTIAEAWVKVPEDFYIGPLPYNLGRQLVFPVGEFQGWWDIVELRYAVELGCDITILKQLEAEEEPVLDEFGKHILDLRMESSKAMGKIWKQFGVLLQGKFGQLRTTLDVKPTLEMTPDEFVGSTPIIESEERYHLVPRKHNYSPYKKPAISMRIKAEARVRHLKYLLEAKSKGDIYYCDTDSVICQSPMETETEPGKLGCRDFASRAYFIKQKFYGYARPTGGFEQRTAGYAGRTLKEENFRSLLNLKEISIRDSRSCSWRDLFKIESLDLITEFTSVIDPTITSKNRILDGLETVPIKLPFTEVPKVFEEALR